MKNPYLSLIQTVWHYGKSWRPSLVALYIVYIFAQICMSLNPYLFGRTIDVIQHFSPGRLHEVVFWLALGVAFYVLFWCFHGPARIRERFIALKIQQKYRIEMYEKLTQLPLKWHQDHHSGNIVTRLNRSSTALFRFAGDQFIYIERIVQFIVSLGFLLWISVPVGLMSLITCVLSIVTILMFDKRLIPLYHSENEIDNHIGANFFDYINNMTTVLTLRLGELTKTNLYQRILSVWPIYRKEVIINEVKWFTMGTMLTALQSLILIGYIVYTLHNSASLMIGSIVMIYRYQASLSEVFYVLSQHYGELVQMDTDIKGMQPILDDLNRLAHKPISESLAKQWHRIDIENLEFHHAGRENLHNTIDDIDFSIKRGEKIALIGLSGGGKSTLLNLLLGLYTPSQVVLTLDGVKFDTLEPLQSITTLIPQDPELFENTIEFNITMDVDCPQAEIDQAIFLARFDTVLKTLPLGLKTDIREKGLNLSVGQKQRLALARGLFAARYSSLILMDEPTSSVDLPTEKEILQGTIKAYPNAAMIVSLHRLHLLPQFDRIIMMEHGKIIADGETKTLLQSPGKVRDLWLSSIEGD
ncbi:MAG: ABC transporter ATP-binding protein [Tatlockia sp.]|nr:ABC transporter ATP-binding protein [Tatlockia sp.]